MPDRRHSVSVSLWREVVGELAAAQKPARGVSLWSRFVNRPLGRLLAAGAIVLGISANGVTAISAVVTLAGFVLLVAVPPAPWLGLVVAILLVGGFALDSADGQVARHTKTGSPAGEWLDHVVDAGKMVAAHTAVLVGWYRFVDLPDAGWLALPLAFQLVSVVMYAGGTLAPLLRKGDGAERAPSTVRATVLLLADYGVFAASFATWGWPPLFRWVYLVLAVATTLIAVLLSVRWFRGLRAPQAAR